MWETRWDHKESEVEADGECKGWIAHALITIHWGVNLCCLAHVMQNCSVSTSSHTLEFLL